MCTITYVCNYNIFIMLKVAIVLALLTLYGCRSLMMHKPIVLEIRCQQRFYDLPAISLQQQWSRFTAITGVSAINLRYFEVQNNTLVIQCQQDAFEPPNSIINIIYIDVNSNLYGISLQRSIRLLTERHKIYYKLDMPGMENNVVITSVNKIQCMKQGSSLTNISHQIIGGQLLAKIDGYGCDYSLDIFSFKEDMFTPTSPKNHSISGAWIQPSYRDFQDICSRLSCQILNISGKSRLLQVCDNFTYLDELNSICVPCDTIKLNCHSCNGPPTPTCLTCMETYYMDSATNCVSCQSISVANCLKCTDDLTCTECTNYYFLSDGVCTHCGTDCSVCSSETNCLTCEPQSYLSGDGSCQPCSVAIFGCQYCQVPTACLTCNIQYLLVSGECEDCRFTVPNCYECGSSTTCNICYVGYYLIGDYECRVCNATVPNCATCTGDFSCQGCRSGYYLASASSCPKCDIVNCRICISNTYCSSCRGGFFPNNSNSVCSLCSTGCLSCVNDTQCNLCNTSYILSNSYCYSCPVIVTGCATCLSSGCTSCIATYYYTSSSKSCTLCSSTIANCNTCSSGTNCQTCQPTFYLTAPTTCQTCPTGNCVTCSSSGCSVCAITYYLVDPTNCSTCVTTIPFCLECTDTPTCTKCNSTLHALDGSGGCQLCSVTLTGCVDCTSSTVCIGCGDGFWLDGSACTACPTGCLTCDSATNCFTCDVTHYFDVDMCYICSSPAGMTNCLECVQSTKCQKCVNNTFYVDGLFMCVLCSSTTTNCTTCAADGNCTACDSTYFLNETICQTCITSASLVGCQVCASGTQCSACISNAFYYDIDIKNCVPCPTDRPLCLTCSDVATCLTCVADFQPSGGVCTACNVLLSNCQSCTAATAGSCTACNDTLHWLDGGNCPLCQTALPNCVQCSSDATVCMLCLPAFFVDPTDGKTCKTCSPTLANCVECSTHEICTKCDADTHFLRTQDNKCYPCSDNITDCAKCTDNLTCTECLVGSYLVGIACDRCTNVDPNCLQCSATPACTKCSADYFVDGGLCSVCTGIAPNCLTCGGTSTCTVCLDNTFLLQTGNCVACPAGCLTCTHTVVDTPGCLTCDVYHYLSGVDCLPCQGAVGSPMENCRECVVSDQCQVCVNNTFFVHPLTNLCALCSSTTTNCTTCAADGNCTACDSTYFLNETICQTCITSASLVGCQVCASGTQCSACISNAFYFSEAITNCVPCPDGRPQCLTCSDVATCLTCVADFQPSGGICTACNVLLSNCQSCTAATAGSCTACNDTLHWLDGGNCPLCQTALPNCVQCSSDATVCMLCLPAFFVDPTDGKTCKTCSPTLANCVECSTHEICTKCDADTHFLRTQDNKCYPCSDNITDCAKCTDNLTCTECLVGSYLVGIACDRCTNVDPNCLQCSATPACTKCSADYFVDGGLCSVCTGIAPNCLTCGGTSTCTVCLDNTFLLQTGNCVACPAGCLTCTHTVVDTPGCLTCDVYHYLSGVDCLPCQGAVGSPMENCRECVVSTECLVCNSTAFYINTLTHFCIQCSQTTPNCSTCDLSGECNTCASSYFLNGTICQPCNESTSLVGCQICVSGEECSDCISDAYYYDIDIKNCVPCPTDRPLCLTCSDVATCLTCVADFQPSGGVCTACNVLLSNCQSCTAATAGSCTACNDTLHWLDGGNCPLCQTALPNCVQCSSDATVCMLCLPAFFVDPTDGKTCKTCSPTLANCVECSTHEICTKCDADTHFLRTQDNKCYPCSDNITDCAKCTDNLTCTECLVGSYLVGIACDRCTNVDPNCLQCSATPACTKCSADYFVDGGLCSVCTGIAPNCLTCGGTSTCTVCLDNTFLLQTGNCVACPAGCLTCTHTVVDTPGCLTCDVYHYLSGVDCLPCQGTVGSPMENCRECVVSDQCQVCINNVFYVKPSTHLCIQCSQTTTNCTTCDSTGICEACETSYFLNATICQRCSQSNSLVGCQICVGGTECSACVSNAFYYDSTNKVCIPCQTDRLECVTCSNATTCLSCIADFQPSAGVCTACYILLTHCKTCSGTTLGSCTVCNSTMHWLNEGNCELCNNVLPNCVQCSSDATVCMLCLPAFFVDPTDGKTCKTCSPTLANCVECSTHEICTKCDADTHFLRTQDNKCYPCSDNITDCAKCTDNLTCTECLVGSYLVGIACDRCTNVDPNCLQCSATPACTKCSADYFVDGGLCSVCAGIAPNCLTCGGTSTCTVCLDNTFLLQTGNCVACPAGCLTCTHTVVDTPGCLTCDVYHYLSGVDCLPCQGAVGSPMENCRECVVSDQCQVCVNNTFFVHFSTKLCTQCVSATLNCTTCNPLTSSCESCSPTFYINTSSHQCQTCTDSLIGCVLCSSNQTCTSCIHGFYLASTTCTVCSDTYPQCVSCLPSGCTECANRYYVSSPDCVLCSDTYSNCVSCVPTGCTNCVVGYHVQLSGCTLCNTTYANCVECVPSSCTNCSSGYYLTSPSCTLCSVTYPHCASCIPTGCEVCQDGSYLSAASCTVCNVTYPNCVSCLPGGCTTCADNYYVSSTTCTLCNDTYPHCLSCVPSGCTTCRVGSYLSSMACTVCSVTYPNCVECLPNTCSVCSDGYYLSSTTCTMCSDTYPHCESCIPSGCTSCQDGSYLSSGSCTICNITYSNCESCLPAGCTTCAAGYYLSYPTCTLCNNTYANCYSCTSSSSGCSTCQPNSVFLANGSCSTCDALMPGCETCANTTHCSTCTNPNFEYDVADKICRTRRWLEVVSIKKLTYQNKLVLALSFSEDVDPYSIQVSIPHDNLAVTDVHQTLKVEAARTPGSFVGAVPGFFYEVEGTCNLNIQYTENLEGNDYQLWVTDSAGHIKVSSTFSVTSITDELVYYFPSSYYSLCRTLNVLYMLELSLSVIGLCVSVHFAMKLAFMECLTILIYLPLFIAVFKKVDSAMYAIREIGISDAACAIALMVIGCLPYIISGTMKLLSVIRRFKEYKNGLKRMSQIFIKEVSLVMAVLLIGFIPYSLRLAEENAQLRAGLIVATVLYLPCISYTLYHYIKSSTAFGELSMQNPKNTFTLGATLLSVNLFFGLMCAASRYTYLWYIFIGMAMGPLVLVILFAIKRPLPVSVQNIRCILNYSILTVNILVFNAYKTASQGFIVMFYLGTTLVSLAMSVANLVYSKTGEIYKARIELGERKDSEMEHLGKAIKKGKYDGLDSSSESLSSVSKKALVDQQVFGLDSQSSSSAKVLRNNIFDSRQKLKRKEYDLKQDNKLDRDTKEMFAFASVPPEKANGYESSGQLSSAALDLKSDNAQIEEITDIQLLSKLKIRSDKKRLALEPEDSLNSLEETAKRLGTAGSKQKFGDNMTTKQNIKQEEIKLEDVHQLEPNEALFIRSGEGFKKKDSEAGELDKTKKKKQKKIGKTYDRNARLINEIEKSKQPQSYLSDAMKTQLSRGLNSHIRTGEEKSEQEEMNKTRRSKSKKKSNLNKSKEEIADEAGIQVQNIEDADISQDQIKQSELYKGITFSKTSKSKGKSKGKSKEKKDQGTDEENLNTKEGEDHEIIIENIEEYDQNGQEQGGEHKRIKKNRSKYTDKNIDQIEKKNPKLAKYLRNNRNTEPTIPDNLRKDLQRTKKRLGANPDNPNDQQGENEENLMIEDVEELEDDEQNEQMERRNPKNRSKKYKHIKSTFQRQKEPERKNKFAEMLDQKQMTEEERQAEQQRLIQKYKYKGKKGGRKGENEGDNTIDQEIKASIAEFLPANNEKMSKAIKNMKEYNDKNDRDGKTNRKIKKNALGTTEGTEGTADNEILEDKKGAEDMEIEDIQDQDFNSPDRPSKGLGDNAEHEKLVKQYRQKNMQKQRSKEHQTKLTDEEIKQSLKGLLPTDKKWNQLKRAVSPDKQNSGKPELEVEELDQEADPNNPIQMTEEEREADYQRMVEKFKNKKIRKAQKAAESKEKGDDRKAIMDSIASFLPQKHRNVMERALRQQHSKYVGPPKAETQQEESEDDGEPKQVELSQTEEAMEAEQRRLIEKYKYKGPKRARKNQSPEKELDIDRRAVLDSIAQFLPQSKRDVMERALKEQHSKYVPKPGNAGDQPEEAARSKEGEQSKTEEEIEAEQRRLIEKYKYKGAKQSRKNQSPEKQFEYDRRAVLDSIAQFLPQRHRDVMERALREQHSRYVGPQELLGPNQQPLEISEMPRQLTEQQREAEHQKLVEKYRYRGPKNKHELKKNKLMVASMDDLLPDKNRARMERMIREHDWNNDLQERSEHDEDQDQSEHDQHSQDKGGPWREMDEQELEIARQRLIDKNRAKQEAQRAKHQAKPKERDLKEAEGPLAKSSFISEDDKARMSRAVRKMTEEQHILEKSETEERPLNS